MIGIQRAARTLRRLSIARAIALATSAPAMADIVHYELAFAGGAVAPTGEFDYDATCRNSRT